MSHPPHRPAQNRYDSPGFYARCGRSGLLLPRISLGLWHNFGGFDPLENQRALILRAFDLGITHFDLANNYGPPTGSAEENFGRILTANLAAHRDELIVSTKAGFRMWPGPYGESGSRKHLLASLDASLRRLRLDYVDIFYHHRPDPSTPLEETMAALAHAVRSGKALYVGVSNYDASATARAAALLRDLGVPALVHQPIYNLLNRDVESGLLDILQREGLGCIAFSPLAQGLLTDRYLQGIPPDSRAANPHSPFLDPSRISPSLLAKLRKLETVALARGQSLARLALAWVLRDSRVTSALVGASKPSQIEDCVGATLNTSFAPEELARIDAILAEPP